MTLLASIGKISQPSSSVAFAGAEARGRQVSSKGADTAGPSASAKSTAIRVKSMDDKKLAVLFPGIGYHCDKPLLYYSAKLAQMSGYEVLPVPYAGFPEKVRGDGDKLRACLEIAWTQAEEMLGPVEWEDYGNLLFIGKSIGTIVASRYAAEKNLAVRNILLTPLVETFPFVQGKAVAFHGTADPWAETRAVVAACEEKGIPLYLTEGANHSLETGDALRDVRTLEETMRRIDSFIREDDA